MDESRVLRSAPDVERRVTKTLPFTKQVRMCCSRCGRMLEVYRGHPVQVDDPRRVVPGSPAHSALKAIGDPMAWLPRRPLTKRPTGLARPSELSAEGQRLYLTDGVVPVRCHRACGHRLVLERHVLEEKCRSTPDGGKFFV